LSSASHSIWPDALGADPEAVAQLAQGPLATVGERGCRDAARGDR
jgi:hypothetical protein